MRTFETVEPVDAVVELGRGTVHLIASERGDTVVSVNPSDRGTTRDVEEAERTTVALADGVLTVRGHRQRPLTRPVLGWKRSGGSVDVVVELPAGSRFRADVGWVDVRCDGRLGEVEVKAGCGAVRLDRTGSARVRNGLGDVTVDDASGRVEVVTCGAIDVGAAGGGLDIKNHSGAVRVGRVGGPARVKSANGDVAIDDSAGDVVVQAANGDIELNRVTRGSVNAETAFGSVRIGVGRGTAAWVDASTGFGRFHNELGVAAEPEPSVEKVRVRARTGMGDVVISRAPFADRSDRV